MNVPDQRRFLKQGSSGLKWLNDDAAREAFFDQATALYEEVNGSWLNAMTTLKKRLLMILTRFRNLQSKKTSLAVDNFAVQANAMVAQIVL